jgi:hypothetical protein
MQQPADHEYQARQHALYQYMDAFRRGDFETMLRILAQAEHDPQLEDLIWNVQSAVAAEHVSDVQRAHDVQQVQDLLRRKRQV